MRVSRHSGHSVRVVTDVDSLVYHTLHLTERIWHWCLKGHRLVHDRLIVPIRNPFSEVALPTVAAGARPWLLGLDPGFLLLLNRLIDYYPHLAR